MVLFVLDCFYCHCETIQTSSEDEAIRVGTEHPNTSQIATGSYDPSQ